MGQAQSLDAACARPIAGQALHLASAPPWLRCARRPRMPPYVI